MSRALRFAAPLLLASVLTAQEAPRQTFRSRVTVVPIDVRVVDRQGRPVTDLKREDFTLIEDGVPQQIVHFSLQQLEATPAAAAGELPFRKPLGETVAPQARRIFLFVMGRGRQTGPGRHLDALRDFVRNRLLPQDQVALLAYNRATDFTTDHARLLDVVERYRQKHEGIETRLAHHFSGLTAVYGDKAIPPGIQRDIDALFEGAALRSRSTSATQIADGVAVDRDTRNDRQKIESGQAAADRIAAGMATPFDQSIVDQAGLIDMEFDEFVERSSETNQDLGNLYAGVRYMRYLEGEKHLVFLTRSGLFLPRLENANSLAALASDARVTIDVLHTGGVTGGPAIPPPSRLPPGGTARSMAILNSIASPSATFQQAFSVGNSRQIAALTGGQVSAFEAGERLFKRLDESTRTQYLLGYTPTNTDWNGKFRRIQVKVARRDVTVLYRHGYAARQEVAPLDRRTYLTYSRIAAAANNGRPIADLQITIKDARVVAAEGGRFLEIDVHLSPRGLTFAAADALHRAGLEATYFAADSKGQLTADLWRTLNFELTAENHARFQREGVGWTQRVPLTGDARDVKVVLYQYDSDLTGSSVFTVKKR